MPRRQRELVQVIFWRDIPAQISATSGGQSHKALLTARFQHAIDRAAAVAELTDHESYIAEWRRIELAVEPDAAQQVNDLSQHYEDEYPRDRLEALVAAGGVEPSA